MKRGLTYDDVLLIPQRSSIDSRADVSLATNLTENIKLNMPIISANMATITESNMSIAMAQQGGIGFIHRFMSIEDEVWHVKRVKDCVGMSVEYPQTIKPSTPLSKIKEIIKYSNKTGFVVVDDAGYFLGIVSKRDYEYETKESITAVEMMTPMKHIYSLGKIPNKKKAKEFFKECKVEKLPIIDDEGKFVKLITAKSLESFEKHPDSTRDSQDRYVVGASVGVIGDYIERTEALIEAGVDIIVVDVAHGHNRAPLVAIKEIRNKFPHIDIVGGNVATADGTEDLIDAGANVVKVGIGPGAMCTTRIVAGVGVPQLTAIIESSKIAKKKGATIIADGGIKYSGDITKALVGGASTVMLGSLFAGTDESPGETVMRKDRKYKAHRGSASFLSSVDRIGGKKVGLNSVVAEGVEALIPCKGNVGDTIYQLLGGLRSGMSYCNAMSIAELQENGEFIEITNAGFRESKSHIAGEI